MTYIRPANSQHAGGRGYLMSWPVTLTYFYATYLLLLLFWVLIGPDSCVISLSVGPTFTASVLTRPNRIESVGLERFFSIFFDFFFVFCVLRECFLSVFFFSCCCLMALVGQRKLFSFNWAYQSFLRIIYLWIFINWFIWSILKNQFL